MKKEPTKERKIAYEWILTLSRGPEVILSEAQYAFYKKQIQDEDYRKLFFSDVEVNPPFVVSAYRQPAVYIKSKYPCKDCYSTGVIIGNKGVCLSCEGTGISLPTT